MRRAAALAGLATLLVFGTGDCQLPPVRGYYLNVPLWSDSTAFSVGGVSDINRLRLMSAPRLGPLRFDVAYEHLLTYRQRRAEGFGGLAAVIVPAGGEWFDLQWRPETSEHLVWQHRFDRLSVSWSPVDPIEITAGRQTISWATTLFLTPADPFVPFDPSDPFREYRAGVDAVRLQAFFGTFTDVDLVVRPSSFVGPAGDEEETLTALARGRTVLTGWEIAAWAGLLHDDAAGALGLTGALGAWALRAEASLRELDGDLAVRSALGLNTRLTTFDRDLYLAFEYQHDDLGAAGAEELVGVVLSPPFARGELQVLGADVVLAQSSYQLHPLLSTDLLALVSLGDGSALLAPAASVSASNELSLRAGAFLGVGEADGDSPGLPSEFGIIPTILYISASIFF